MEKNRFIAGVAKALLFANNQLIAVGKTFTSSAFNFSIENTEIRGGQGNALISQYFYNSNLGVSIEDATFHLEYMALNLGIPVNQGGVVCYESAGAGDTVGVGGVITLTHTVAAFDGVKMAWYKKPSDENWAMATVSATNTITIPGATQGETYCVKYFYQDLNARSLTIKTKYVPSCVHLVLINDIYEGSSQNLGNSAKVGNLIVDIPKFQLQGASELNLTSTTAATTSFSGNALAVLEGVGCEEDPYYGTMTEQIFNADWKSNLIALACTNNDMELANGATETIEVYGVFNGMTSSRKLDNSNFTFAVESGTSATVNANTGVVTAGSTDGVTYISVTLTGSTDVPPEIVMVTVA